MTSQRVPSPGIEGGHRWPLWRQITVSLFVATIFVSTLAGGLAWQIGERQLGHLIQRSGERATALVSATAADAVIVEDIPVLQTVVEQSAAADEAIESFWIRNANGRVLASMNRAGDAKREDLVSTNGNIVISGQKFGTVEIVWNLETMHRDSALHVSELVLFIVAALFLLTAAITLFGRLLIAAPVAMIDSRLASLRKGEELDQGSLPPYTARELLDLDDSVTKLGAAWEALRSSEAQLVDAQRIAGLGNWNWDLVKKGLSVSEETSRILGREDGWPGGTLDALLERTHPEDRDCVEAALHKALDKGEALSLEHRIVTLDGDVKFVHHRAKAVFDKTMAPLRVTGTIHDITERKTAERALQQAHKMEALGKMAGGIAHNFNNLLLPIMMMTEKTLNELPKDSVGRTQMEIVLAAAHKAKDIVNQILATSRKTEQRRSRQDIASLVDNALTLARQTITPNILIERNLDAAAGAAAVDAAQIQSALLNILANAANAMEGMAGTLTVSLDRIDLDEKETAAIQGLSPGPYARISVSDTGRGMDEATVSQMFDPFFTTKGVGQGTGMGMTSAYGVVRQHQGAIQVFSAIGEGTTITVYLPLAET